MKVTKFAISVQYGSGMHYFLRTDYDNINEVISKANSTEHNLLRQYKRGAKPTVHVWERVRSFAPDLLLATQKPVSKQSS